MDFTQTKYNLIKDRLVPKHLSMHQNERKRQKFKEFFLMPPLTPDIQASKLAFLQPVKDIQMIMNHFDKQFKGSYNKANENSVIKNKAKSLFKLPIITKARKQRENAEKKDSRVQKLLNQFALYIKYETRINPGALSGGGRLLGKSNIISNRCKTSVQ